MKKTIDIFEVKVESKEFIDFIETYPEQLVTESSGMNMIWKEKSTGIVVAMQDHGFFSDDYTVYKFKKE